MDEADQLAALEEALGYRFEDRALLRDAVTHRSYANEKPRLAPVDNERMEFLGDAVAGLVASALLWEHFPDAREGELTRRRADLVCEAGMETIARALDLGPVLRLGRGEDRSGGREKPRLLASALEAVLAAVFLDGGAEMAMQVGRRLFTPRVHDADPGASDFKSRVQELAQSRGAGTPRYELLRAEGPDHDRRFYVAILVGDEKVGEGDGRSKVEAEQAAAEVALRTLEADPAVGEVEAS